MTPSWRGRPLLIDPPGQCTAHPIMPPCRGVGMTGSPPRPAPRPDPRPEPTINPVLTVRNRPRPCLRRPHRSSTTAPASTPSGRYAVGLRPSLDPDAYVDVCAATEDNPKSEVTKDLTGPAPGMTCGNA